jgi:hypothetical protein
MIANPDILRLAENPVSALIAMLRLALGLALVSYGLISARKAVKTAVLVAGGLAVIFSGLYV